MLNLNDLVTVKPAYRGKYHGAFRVIALPGGARKKHLIQSVTSDLKINAYSYMLDLFTGDVESAAVAGPPPAGSFVTFLNHAVDPKRVFVVIATTKSGARIVNPGGGGGYRNVAFSSLTILDPATVIKPLVAV